jgi:translation initiation factor 2 beta subunit (eIF-2beta)/eIF-5
MNLLLKLSQLYLPGFIKKKKLQELYELTAEAFNTTPPSIKNLSYYECLKAYAQFSNAKAEEVITSKSDTEMIKKRLYQNAYRLGKKLRRDFHIKTWVEVIQLSKILYRILKIDFQGDRSGNVVIRRCFFSSYYSEEVCRIISALDEGIAAGLSAGGALVFKERITAGKSCCRATFNLT